MTRARWLAWTVLLGFALGGVFDGIVLHQLLQWHHLLSLVPQVGEPQGQILWDGLFHALMYALAGLALWAIWRGRGEGRPLAGPLLLGFGTWHLVDAVLFHWLLGLHRIRVGAEQPLLWDLGWLAAFGLVPMALGWGLLRRSRRAHP